MTEEAESLSKQYYTTYPSNMPLDVMQALVKDINVANGWFDSERTFGDDIALLHSEVSEAFEAYRSHGLEDATSTSMPYCCLTSGAGACDDAPHIPKPEGVGSELADIFVRLLDTCERYNIDLQTEFHRKMKYNATRGHRHGNKKV